MEVIHKIKLDDAEINEAITQYLENNGISIKDKTLDINLTAGRKNGNYCDIDIISNQKNVSEPLKDTETSQVDMYEDTATIPEEDLEDSEDSTMDVEKEVIVPSTPFFGRT